MEQIILSIIINLLSDFVKMIIGNLNKRNK